MNEVTKKLITNFNIIDKDFMGYIIEPIDKLTYHHIIKKENGGKKTYKNGAILIRDTSHNYIHIIEDRELDMYLFINKILKEINRQGYLPTHSQLLKIYECLDKFERDHSGDINCKGTPLIKERFTKRTL